MKKEIMYTPPCPQKEKTGFTWSSNTCPCVRDKKVISGYKGHSGGRVEVESSLGWIEDEWELRKWRQSVSTILLLIWWRRGEERAEMEWERVVEGDHGGSFKSN